jgi:hypothetical protein
VRDDRRPQAPGGRTARSRHRDASPRPSLTIHQHRDDRGPFWVVTCSLGCPESPPFDGPGSGIAAAYWEAAHDLAHEDEWRAAS